MQLLKHAAATLFEIKFAFILDQPETKEWNCYTLLVRKTTKYLAVKAYLSIISPVI